jgi:hypothetical protein
MTDYVVGWFTASGYVFGMWTRTTSDNGSTAQADGHLTIDGTKVLDGVPASGGDPDGDDIDFATLTDPTDTDLDLWPGVLEVDNATTPTDVTERTDGGRNPDYPDYSS